MGVQAVIKWGGAGRNRTADTRIFSHLLYRLSYRTKAYFLNGMQIYSFLEKRQIKLVGHKKISYRSIAFLMADRLRHLGNVLKIIRMRQPFLEGFKGLIAFAY